jgi:hypothetical protein
MIRGEPQAIAIVLAPQVTGLDALLIKRRDLTIVILNYSGYSNNNHNKLIYL